MSGNIPAQNLVDNLSVVSAVVAPILAPGQTTTSPNPPVQTPAQQQPPQQQQQPPQPQPQPQPQANGGGNTPVASSPGSLNTGNTPNSPSNSGPGSGTTVTPGGGNSVPAAPSNVGTRPGNPPNLSPNAGDNSTTVNNGGGTGVNSTTTSTSSSSGGSTGGHSVNVGNTPNNGVPNAGTGTSAGGGRSGSSSSGVLISGNPSDPSVSATDVATLSSGSGSRGGGFIAAAVVIPLLLLLFAVVIFVIRRRSRARREEQAIKWWFTRNRTSQVYGDSRNSTDGFASDIASRRSSFGTSIDHSNVHFVEANIPPPPPMAEIGRPNGTAPSLVLDTDTDEKRYSIGSAGSHNSQFLVVHHRESLRPENVKSYTESFSFPKPPSVDRSSLHSKGSDRWRADSIKKQSSPLSPIRSSTPDVEVLYVASPPGIALPPLYPILAQPQAALITADPFTDNNPFDDPALAVVELTNTLSAVETVRRPFSPQLEDELQISVGESVRIIQAFDDGWALVSKVSSVSQGDAKEQQGLIPLDCLSEPNQTSDLNLMRMSSRGGVQNV